MKIYMKDYNIDSFKEKDIYTWDEIIDKILDLESEIYKLNERIKEREKDIEDNFERVDVSRQYYISDFDFIDRREIM